MSLPSNTLSFPQSFPSVALARSLTEFLTARTNLSHLTFIETLDCAGIKFDSLIDIAHVAEFIKLYPGIKTVNLVDIEISDEGLLLLVGAANKSSSITTVHLSTIKDTALGNYIESTIKSCKICPHIIPRESQSLPPFSPPPATKSKTPSVSIDLSEPHVVHIPNNYQCLSNGSRNTCSISFSCTMDCPKNCKKIHAMVIPKEKCNKHGPIVPLGEPTKVSKSTDAHDWANANMGADDDDIVPISYNEDDNNNDSDTAHLTTSDHCPDTLLDANSLILSTKILPVKKIGSVNVMDDIILHSKLSSQFPQKYKNIQSLNDTSRFMNLMAEMYCEYKSVNTGHKVTHTLCNVADSEYTWFLNYDKIDNVPNNTLPRGEYLAIKFTELKDFCKWADGYTAYPPVPTKNNSNAT